MAAHLRFLFDSRVAPHGRWADARTQREALVVSRRSMWPAIHDEPRTPLRHVARSLRDRFPADYASEGEEATLRRMYRISRTLASRSRRSGCGRFLRPPNCRS
jgi:hypothetical protein